MGPRGLGMHLLSPLAQVSDVRASYHVGRLRVHEKQPIDIRTGLVGGSSVIRVVDGATAGCSDRASHADHNGQRLPDRKAIWSRGRGRRAVPRTHPAGACQPRLGLGSLHCSSSTFSSSAGTQMAMLDRLIGSDLSFYIGTWALEPNSRADRPTQNSLGGIFSEGMSLGLEGAYSRSRPRGMDSTLPALATTGFGAAGVGLMVSLASGLSALLASGATLLIATHSAGVRRAPLPCPDVPWSVAIARSMYWTIGIKLLPARILIRVMRSQRRSIGGWFWCRYRHGAFRLRSTLPSSRGCPEAAVVAYYSVAERWSVGSTLRHLASLVGAVLVGFVRAPADFHLAQLFWRTGDARESRNSKGRRSHGRASDPLSSRCYCPADGGFGDARCGAGTCTSSAGTGRTGLLVVQQFTDAALLLATGLVIVVGLARRPANSAAVEQGSTAGGRRLGASDSVMHTFMNVSLWFLPTARGGPALAPCGAAFGGRRPSPCTALWIALVAL